MSAGVALRMNSVRSRQIPTIQSKHAQYEGVPNPASRPHDKSVPDHHFTRGIAVTTDNTAPTAGDIALVRRTFDLVVPIVGVTADLFYERLFYMAPSLRRMFPEDMRDQKRKLMMMLAMAVNGLSDLDTLAPPLMHLGARHAGYGVKDHHYKAVGEALIWALERGLADQFTPEVERAWVRVYLLVAATMQAGADEVRTMQAAE